MKSNGLEEIPLSNNPAETSNFVFKTYLRATGIRSDELSKKKTSQVLFAAKSYLEMEWYNSAISIYSQGEYEVKSEYKRYMEKNIDDKPQLIYQTYHEVVKEVNDSRKGEIFIIIM